MLGWGRPFRTPDTSVRIDPPCVFTWSTVVSGLSVEVRSFTAVILSLGVFPSLGVCLSREECPSSGVYPGWLGGGVTLSLMGELVLTHATVLSRHPVMSMSGKFRGSPNSPSTVDSRIAFNFAFSTATRIYWALWVILLSLFFDISASRGQILLLIVCILLAALSPIRFLFRRR